MSESHQVHLRNKVWGSKYRIIRTEAIGSDLYWVVKWIDDAGNESKSTSRLSVDLWATGEWVEARV